ncbi:MULTISPECIES: hypothetical protein [unclassified Acinetobacter]|nr:MULTISPECIES: hypothetical protein [unclassified Acinetobacter]
MGAKVVNDKKYRAMTNETCAKEAYRILSSILNDKFLMLMVM